MSTPLAKKLGIQPDSSILVLNSPKFYTNFFHDFPSNVIIHEHIDDVEIGFIHLFVQTQEELDYFFPAAKKLLLKNGMLWMSWPKKAGSLSSEIDQSHIRKAGLSGGLVDVKVASINQDWSGIKFMYRIKDR